MVRKVMLVGITLQFSLFFIFACFLGIVKNYLYLHVVNSLALFLFLTYELQ